jgi:sugar phosphate isomerase/epimerase
MQRNEIENGLGLVSNCWKVQLDAGVSLASLVARASEEGFRFVELRQGCLGECEDSETRLPHADLLKRLAQDFSEITFDLAVELPVFSESIDIASKDVEDMLKGARDLSSKDRPAHLRIVDLVSKSVPNERSASDESKSGFCLEDVVESLRELSNELPFGIVSVEHSFQPWTGFRKLFEVARRQNDAPNPSPQLCYDPCNLWLTNNGQHANEITESLHVEWLSMVHLKQRVGGSISPRLEAGDVGWHWQLELLNRAGYEGPFLFETAPSGNVWQCLADSRQHLAEIVRGLS